MSLATSIKSSTSSAISMRGLTVFISDIRQCQNKEQEQKRVDKELANIRQKFLGNGSLSSYQKKKYVWKMLYIHMLGYELDFGHMEAINLVSANKYSEKSVGYLGCTLLLHEDHELLALLINSMRNDILSHNEHFQTLALQCICNIGSQEFAEALAPDVIKILFPEKETRKTKNVVKKRACLCLLRLYRKVPEILTQDDWSERMLTLLDERDVGVLTSAMSLFVGIVSVSHEGYELAVPKICQILRKFVIEKDCAKEYAYYHLPSPWLQVKLLTSLQFFPLSDMHQNRDVLDKVLEHILDKTELQKNVNKNNAHHAIFFEAIRLVVHLQGPSSLVHLACGKLGKYITLKDSNLRYTAIETMALMAENNDVSSQLARHQTMILASLFKENDISIRKSCLDLLYSICGDDSAEEIVSELLRFLENADYLIKEEVVLKIAVLAERHAVNHKWYVDVVLQLIKLAGDFVAEDVWWRVVQIVTNQETVQPYAAAKVYKQLKEEGLSHETLVKTACHILGEFADLAVRDGVATSQEILDLLVSKSATAAAGTKAMFLTTFGKLGNMFPELQKQVWQLYQQHDHSLDPELQQRSCEYAKLAELGSLQNKVFEVMPLFTERESSVMKLIQKKIKGAVVDGDKEQEEATATRERATSETHQQHEGGDVGSSSRSRVAPQAVDSLLDLDDPQQPHLSQQGLTQQPQAATEDLADLFGGPTPQAPVVGGTSIAECLAQHEGSLLSIAAQPVIDGTLYEDSNIHIDIKAQFSRHQARLAVCFQNKTQFALTNFESVIEHFPALEIQNKPAANRIEGQSQQQHLAMVQCVQAFSEMAGLTVSFVAGGETVRLPLKLPICATHFVAPQQFLAADFFSKWNSLCGNGLDRQQIFLARDDSCLEKHVIDSAISNLRLASLAGVDKNPGNGVAAGTMMTKTEGFALLVRIEVNMRDKMLRLSVRSSSAPIASIVERLLMSILSRGAS